MARTMITPQKIGSAGLVPTPEPANADGNSFPADATLAIVNGTAGVVTATIPTPAQIDGLDVADRTFPVTAGETGFINLDGHHIYLQPNGTCHVDLDVTTDVDVYATR